YPSRSDLESSTAAGDSPVGQRRTPVIRSLSTTQHVKVSPNPRGPSRKAKYSLATDSEPSSASERWEEPLSGEDSEPETTRLQAVGARLADVFGRPRGVTACLLHNDPATYRPRRG